MTDRYLQQGKNRSLIERRRKEKACIITPTVLKSPVFQVLLAH